MPDQIQDWMNWAAGLTGATEGDPLLTHDEITDIVDSVVSGLGSLTSDPGTIPTTATARPRGAFEDPHDLQNYLEGGGLITYDGSGNPVPSPIVYILKTPRPGSDDFIYEVWIDDNT